MLSFQNVHKLNVVSSLFASLSLSLCFQNGNDTVPTITARKNETKDLAIQYTPCDKITIIVHYL